MSNASEVILHEGCFFMDDLYPFTVAWEQHLLKGDAWPGEHRRTLLCIHGAGQSERKRFAHLRAALHARGVGSVAFDCVGHGETGGAMAESSLARRTLQAEAVIDARGLEEPLVLLGSSMGAYAAIKLAQSRRVGSLILVVPGVYTPEAYHVPFGPEFSSVIRRERSWADSDAWDILSRFTGRLLVIAAEHDNVIPLEIPQRLVASASASRWSKLHIVEGAQHNRLFSFLGERPAEFEALMEDMTDCVFG